MNKDKVIITVFILLFCLLITLPSCTSSKKTAYYSEVNNYIKATGTVTYMEYNENGDSVYFTFENLTPKFDDNCFKIVGDNLTIVRKNDIDQKISIGDQIEFVTAPKYFGDGYVMPIVAISVNEDELLTFDEGYENWLEWIK